jgi:hypothetical protein
MLEALLAAGLGVLCARELAADAGSAGVRGQTVAGEVVRADLGRQVLLVKIAGREPREMELAIDDATRLTAAGRAIRLEDVRPGERVTASCVPAGPGRCVARLVRAGAGRAAVPAPSPSPGRP